MTIALGTPIEQARHYIQSAVLEPALAHPTLDPQTKDQVRNSGRWLERFTRVGDVLAYLARFKGRTGDSTYTKLHACGLLTFEDIAAEVESRFSAWASDRSSPSSFVVGEQYSSFDILIFVGVYDTRAGGMFLLGTAESPQAVVIKATLNGGRYPNAWLDPHRRLKYYMKSRKDVFGAHFQENAAILKHPATPVMTFVRNHDGEAFTYEGVFKYQAHTSEGDGSKWFELSRETASDLVPMIQSDYLDEELRSDVQRSLADTSAARRTRLAGAPKQPKQVVVQSTAYVRNADVIAEVLARAAGVCEACKLPAPFLRKSDGTPYLEVHHLVQLANGGEDTVENAVAICPNCHRRAHFG